MYSLNRAQIIGNLTRDPEMRYTPNGQAVCSFGVATNRRWRDKDGNNQEATDFHDVVAWTKLAEILSQYAKKGHKIYIEGRLQTRSWEGQDGNKRYRTEIVADNFVFLTPKGAAGAPVAEAPEIEEYPVKDENPPAEEEKPVKKTTKKAPTSDESESRPESVGKESATADEEINLDEIPF